MMAQAEYDTGPVDPGSEPILDQAALDAVRQVMAQDMMIQLVEIMDRTSRETMKLLLDHLDAGDLTAAQRAAHKLKGSAGNLGLRRLWRVSMNIEVSKDLAQARLSAADMHAILEESLTAIRLATQAE